MNYIDLDIMTRGSGDTELEPSEEFPILFGLLTAPMVATNGVKSYFSKYSKSDDYQFEADSSAVSDDGCVHDDDCSSYDITSSEDEDSQSSDEVVSSNPQQHYCHRERKDTDDTEDFPTSTTVDDEDYDDMVIPHSHQPVNTRCITRPSRFLKRSYHQMKKSDSNQNQSSAEEEDTDTDDEEVKGYCFSQGGLERLRMFQLNRLISHASNSPNQRKSPKNDDWEILQNTQPSQTHQDKFVGTTEILNASKHLDIPVNSTNTLVGSSKKFQCSRNKKSCNESAWLEMISRPAQKLKNTNTNLTQSLDSINKGTTFNNSFTHNNQLDKNNSSNILVVDNHTKDTSHNRNENSSGLFPIDTLTPVVTKNINNFIYSAQVKDSIQEPCKHPHNANVPNENVPMYKCPTCDLIFQEKQTFNSHLNNCQANKTTTSKIEGRELN